MTFKHPNFEFKLVEYPSTDGRPYYSTEAARDELELAKEGWSRRQRVWGDSEGTVVVYRRKKPTVTPPGLWKATQYTHKTQGGCYMVRDSGTGHYDVRNVDTGEIYPCNEAYFRAEFVPYQGA